MSEQNDNQLKQQSVAVANSSLRNSSSRRSSTASSIEMLDDMKDFQQNEAICKPKREVAQSAAPESLPTKPSTSSKEQTDDQNFATSLPASLSELTMRTERQRSLVDNIEMSLDMLQKEQSGSSSSSSSSSSQDSEFDHFERTSFNIDEDATDLARSSRDSVRDSLMKLIDLDKKLIDDLKQENESLTRALDINNQYLKQKKSQQEKYEKEIESLEEKLQLLEIENKSLRDHIQRLEARNSNISYPSLGGLCMDTNQETLASKQQKGTSPPSAAMVPQVNSCRLIQLQFDEPAQQNTVEQPVSNELMAICDDLELKLRCLGKKDHFVRLLYKQLQMFKKDIRDGLRSKSEAQQQIESLQVQIEKLRIDHDQRRAASSELPDEHARHHHHSKHHHDRSFHRGHNHRGLKTHSNITPTIHNVHNQEDEKRLSRHMKKREMRAAVQAAKRAAYYNTMIHKHQLYLQQAQSTFDKIKSTSVLSESAAAKHLRGRCNGGLDEDRPYRHNSRRQKLRHMQKEVLHDILATTNKAVVTGYKLASSGVNMALDKLQEIELKQQQHHINAETNHNTIPGSSHNPLIDLIGQVTELAAQALRPMVTASTTSGNVRH